ERRAAARPRRRREGLDRREVRRRDIAGDLVQLVERMLAELRRVLANALLVRRLVDAVRVHEPFVVDDDMAVLPRDLGELLLGELPRAAADRRHLILPDVEAANDEITRHVSESNLSCLR